MKTFILILITLCLSGYSYSSKCKKLDDSKVDICAQKLFLFGDRSGKFPETKLELVDYCRVAQQTEVCIRNYSRKCLNSFPKQVTNLLVRGIVDQQQLFCKKGEEGIVSHGKCGNSNLEKGHRCMDTYIDHLIGINNNSTNNEKIPFICCSFYKFKRCAVSNLKKQKATCRTKSVEFYSDLIHGIAADVLDLICANYKENSELCAKTEKSLPKKKADQKRPKSIILPFTRIIESLSAA